MAVAIRLKRLGTKKKPHYRIVVMDSHRARDSKALEEIGYYDPTREPHLVSVKKDRVLYWMQVGAKPSDAVQAILKHQGMVV